MLERGQAGLDDMHCSRNHARSCTCRDICSGIRTCLKYMFMYMKLSLQRRISACRIAAHSSTKDPSQGISMHALAYALRLHGCALAMCVYFTENTGFDSCTCTWTLQRRISNATVVTGFCSPCLGQRRCFLYMSITKMTRTRAWISHRSFAHCIFARPVVYMYICCPGTSDRSFALHFCSPLCAMLPRNVRKRFAQARPRMLCIA